MIETVSRTHDRDRVRLCLGRKLTQLAMNVLGTVPINCQERRDPTGRDYLAQLRYDVRAASGVGRVVEDRIAQEYDVRHARMR